MTALRRPRPFVNPSRTQLAEMNLALAVQRDAAKAETTALREWIVTWLHGVADGHDNDAASIDAKHPDTPNPLPRKLSAADHRLIAETLRECSRDFEEGRP